MTGLTNPRSPVRQGGEEVTGRPIAVRVVGDAATIDTFVTPGTELAVFVADWAQRCSSTPTAELLVVCVDTGQVVDLADTVSTIDGIAGLATGFELLTAAQLAARHPAAEPVLTAPAAAATVPAAAHPPLRALRTAADLDGCPVNPSARRRLPAPGIRAGDFGGIPAGVDEDRPWTQAFTGVTAARRGSSRPSMRGWRRRGGGHQNWVRPAPEFQGTTVQVCGLWPFAVHGSLPAVGVPSGSHERTGQPVCVDPLSWFEGGITTSPSAAVLGKSSLVKRWIIGWVDQGVIPIVASDVKPDYPPLIRAVGGAVVEAGGGQGAINVLDISVSLDAAERLEADVADRELGRHLAGRLRTAAVDARNTVLAGLVAINRGTANPQDAGIRDWEKALIDRATAILDDRLPPGQAVLDDLVALIETGTDELHAQVAEATDPEPYTTFVKPFVRSLKALTAGSLGSTFAGRTTIALDVTRPLTIDISAIGKSNTTVKAAVMLACWAKVMLDVETLHMLADGGLGPRRRIAIIFEELWNVLGAAGGMVDRLDELSRLNRTMGTAQVLLFHSLVDFHKLRTAEERASANGLVERCGVLCIFGVPKKELGAINDVVELTEGERARLTSWKAEATVDPETGRAQRPPGMGHYLLKTSARAGIPVRIDLMDEELALYNTNERWSMVR